MSLSGILIALLVILIFLAAAIWLIRNMLEAPFQKWAYAILVVVIAIALIYMLTGGAVQGLRLR